MEEKKGHSFPFDIFRGTSGIDIDLRRVDIDQCPQRVSSSDVTLPLNIFAGTDKCKPRTTEVSVFKSWVGVLVLLCSGRYNSKEKHN